MVFQDPQASLNPRKRVEQILATPLKLRGVAKERRRPGRARELLGPGRAQPRAPQPLPARVLRRPAPADRHRPRAGHGPEGRDARRAGLGARRLDPGPGRQPARGPAGRARPDLRVRRPRPVGRAPRLGPDRGDVPRQGHGAVAGARALRQADPSRTRRRCSQAIPIPDPRENRARDAHASSAASRPTRWTRRPAAASTPAARTRPTSAAPSSRRWPSTRAGTSPRAITRAT